MRRCGDCRIDEEAGLRREIGHNRLKYTHCSIFKGATKTSGIGIVLAYTPYIQLKITH